VPKPDVSGKPGSARRRVRFAEGFAASFVIVAGLGVADW
jgi:hypothetical protein